MNYIGWDVGGAHLKVARLNGHGRIDAAIQIAAPIWQGYERLEAALTEACSSLDSADALPLVTMTAELADLFADRRHGTARIIDTFSDRFAQRLLIYAGRAGLVEANQADRYFDDIASANWHAAARYIAGQLGNGLLVDTGSTTTDITRFAYGQIIDLGYSDQQRLQSDTLIYTGVVRTPVMAITDSAPFAGKWQSLAAEHFATCADIYRLTGELDEEDDLIIAADARGKTIDGSIDRLARMLGRDRGADTDKGPWLALARYLSEQQLQTILNGFFRVCSYGPELTDAAIVGAGCGRFLIRKLAQRAHLPYRDFSEFVEAESGLQKSVCRCAPAVALAYLLKMESR